MSAGSDVCSDLLVDALCVSVLKDLMKEIIRMETQIAVIATSQSEHSLNPILISSQGVHLFQCLKPIRPPAQVTLVITVWKTIVKAFIENVDHIILLYPAAYLYPRP